MAAYGRPVLYAIREGREVKYQCVAAHRREYAVAMICRLLQIRRGGFYAWLRRPPSQRSLENGRLKKQITAILRGV